MTTLQTEKPLTARPLEGSEFSSLLQKEFKPKTDQAREAVNK